MNYHLACFTKCQISKVQKIAFASRTEYELIVTEYVSYTALDFSWRVSSPIKIPRALKTEQAKLRNIYVYT